MHPSTGGNSIVVSTGMCWSGTSGNWESNGSVLSEDVLAGRRTARRPRDSEVITFEEWVLSHLHPVDDDSVGVRSCFVLWEWSIVEREGKAVARQRIVRSESSVIIEMTCRVCVECVVYAQHELQRACRSGVARLQQTTLHERNNPVLEAVNLSVATCWRCCQKTSGSCGRAATCCGVCGVRSP